MRPLSFPSRSRTDTLVLYFGAGLLAFLVLVTWLAWRPDVLLHPFRHGQTAFAVLHLDVLGWVVAVMLGAYQNLIPVILYPARVHEWAARGLFWPFLAGVAVFVAGFATGRASLLAAGGTLLAASLVAHALHLAAAVWPRWREWGRVPTALAFALAPVFLAEAALLGVAMALALAGLVSGRMLGFAPLHMAAAIGGWFGLTAMGAAYRLVPLFFTTARGWEESRVGSAPVAMLALAIVLAQVAELAGDSVAGVGGIAGVVGAAGIMLFLWDMARMMRHRTHRKREPVLLLTVASLVHAAVALVALALAHAHGTVPAASVWPLNLAALYLGLFVAPTFLIFGQLSRILVFLATLDLAEWARDHREVRKTWNLSRPALACAGYGLMQAAAVGIVVAMLAGASAGGVLQAVAIVQALGGYLLVASLWPTFRIRLRMR